MVSKLARVLWPAVFGAAMLSCSLFVSLDDLSGGPSPTDASTANDVTTTDSAGAPDAGMVVDANLVNYSAIVLADSPVAYWRLDDDGGIAADQTGHHPGTLVGNVVTGVSGALTGDTAMRFDGTSGFIDIGDVLDFPARAPFSLEAWISPDIVDGNGRDAIAKIVASQLSDGGVIFDGYSFFLQNARGGQFLLCASEPAICTSPIASAPVTGRFTYVVATYDGNVASTYYDGVLVASGAYTKSLIDNTTHLHIGAENGGGFFQGVIDEVAVYDRALTQANVSAHFAARR